MLDEQITQEEELKRLPERVEKLEEKVKILDDYIEKRLKMQEGLNKAIVKEITKLKNIK